MIAPAAYILHVPEDRREVLLLKRPITWRNCGRRLHTI